MEIRVTGKICLDVDKLKITVTNPENSPVTVNNIFNTIYNIIFYFFTFYSYIKNNI